MRAIIATLLLLAGPARVGLQAQDPAARLDSLAERVQRAEETIERLQRQLEEQNQAKVGSRLRNHVTLSGLILANGFYNNARVNNSDAPQFVSYQQDTSGLPNRHLGAAIRQTRLGLAVSDLRALNAILGAELQMDFFGGQQGSSNNRTSPLLRVRTAAVRVDWPHLGVLVGQETPPVSPNNPVSFASGGIPGFAASGNLWLWIPQARVTYETWTRPRVGVQAAALAPMTPSPQGAFATQADSAEKSARPSLQARLYFGWGEGENEVQVGFGVHRGWIATSGDSLLTSQAFTVDWRIPVGEKLLVLGEAFFDGQALGGLGGGGVGQNLGEGRRPVRTRGGWAQINLRPTFEWEVGAGAGLDDPTDADLPAAGPDPGRMRNAAYAGYLHFRPGGGLLLGFEFRRIETRYAAGTFGVNHFNWFAGVSF